MSLMTAEAFWDKLIGPKGTKARHIHEHKVAILHAQDAIAATLTWWLVFLPYGHLARTFWTLVITERRPMSFLDGMSFSYINDAYVLGVRDAIKGKKHSYSKVIIDKRVFYPYIRVAHLYKPPLWHLHLTFHSFNEVIKDHREKA